jgi:hypothetical protein
MTWKTAVTLDEYERKTLINALNEMRNRLLREQRSTDAVEDLMVKLYEARRSHLRIAEENSVERY